MNNQYSPDTFTVVTTVWNNGAATANDVRLTLALPAGLTLTAGALTQTLGSLLVGQEAQVTWTVRAAAQYNPTTLSYAVTASASNADTKTVTRSISLPALQRQAPPPPAYTHSYYIETTGNQPNRQLGCQARTSGDRGVAVLLLGSPRILRAQGEGAPIYGTRLLDGARRQVSLDQIESIVRAFAAGYINGCERNPAPRPQEADLTIIVATSNSKVGGSDNLVLTSGHGEAWAGLITALNQTFQRTYGRAVRAAGGYDTEQEVLEWSSRAPTI